MSSRHVYVAALAAIAVALVFVAVVVATQPKAHAQKHNAYWPYSVETVIYDK